ncbi:MAG: hypothetical protein HQL50_14175 [Magnetococcales bacterium]|nr:hypothetical protein [Magnetococcales bacterium]
MSTQIDTAFAEQFSANVQHLAQQKGSKLRKTVRVENVTGRNAYFDQLGAVAARQRPSRHADTPRMDTPHARRRATLIDYDWADLIDNEDKVKMLIDPSSEYVKAGGMALGRAMDDAIITAADAVAYTGQTGSTSTAFDTNMIVDVQVGGSSSDVGLNIAKLRNAKYLLDSNDVDPDQDRFIVVNAMQMQNLLNETPLQSRDYNTVQGLVEGTVDRYMGFTFIQTERIGVDANSDHKVLFFARDGLLLAIGSENKGRIEERADKNYATQVFCSMSIGATRMEEKKVGYIECDPTLV